MKLTPPEPPGRSTRKTRAFGQEICELRNRGYTFTAIRQALANAGVVVSKSTVQRELQRQERSAGAASTTLTFSAAVNTPPALLAVPTASIDPGQPSPPPEAAAPPPSQPLPPSPPAPSLRGKDIADAFVSGRITNPLLKPRSSP